MTPREAWEEKENQLNAIIAELRATIARLEAERDAYQLASAEHWTESFNPDDENNVVPKVTWYRATCAILQAELNEARKLISDWETPDECRALLQQQLAEAHNEERRAKELLCHQVTHATTLQARITELEAALKAKG